MHRPRLLLLAVALATIVSPWQAVPATAQAGVDRLAIQVLSNRAEHQGIGAGTISDIVREAMYAAGIEPRM